MKQRIRYGGLLGIILFLFASCSSLILKANDYSSPPVAKAPNIQAILYVVKTTPDKGSNPLKRFLKTCEIRLCALMGLLWLWLSARIH